MKICLDQKNAKTFLKIIDGLSEDSPSKKNENSDVFMPLSVELVRKSKDFIHVSLCHYRKINGDLVQDPEILFHVSKGCELLNLKTNKMEEHTFITPMWMQVGGHYFQEAVVIKDDGNFDKFYPEILNSQLEFANMWINNIKSQQGL